MLLEITDHRTTLCTCYPEAYLGRLVLKLHRLATIKIHSGEAVQRTIHVSRFFTCVDVETTKKLVLNLKQEDLYELKLC